MPTTAYSKTFNGEFQVDQLKNLHAEFKEELNLEEDFRAFVKLDVLCPCCNTMDAIVVSKGFSKITNKPVKQAHFAFKNQEGLDSHLKFCDFYSGDDKENLSTNDSLVRIRESNDLLTETIRKFICAGIENNVFSQKNILEMRQWFFDLKSSNTLYVEESKLKLNLFYQLIINEEKKLKQFIYSDETKDLIDIDSEAIRLLSFRVPSINLPNPRKHEDHWIYYLLRSKTVIKNAVKLSIKDDKTYTYDRTLLEKNYRKAWHVSYKIANSVPELQKKYGNSIHVKIKKFNAIMAYATLLLFINEWNVEEALKMHNEKIAPINKIKNMNLGNVIGINPFINYEAWHVLKYLGYLNNQLYGFDIFSEFNKAKSEVLEYYAN